MLFDNCLILVYLSSTNEFKINHRDHRNIDHHQECNPGGYHPDIGDVLSINLFHFDHDKYRIYCHIWYYIFGGKKK